MRIALVVVILVGCAGSIATFFWRQDIKYSLPTPVPTNYEPIQIGKAVGLSWLNNNRSHFLHFYNPDCPCSKFNVRHIKSLVRSYGDSLTILVILASESDIPKAKSELGANLSYRVDADQSIAKACGVYSTPQAAIIDKDGILFYRGNYNASRYCSKRASNFAELSLIALLNHQPSPSFGLLATHSYGCELKSGKEPVSYLLNF